MPSVDITLSLSLDQCRSYYAGAVESIQTYTLDGRRVRFPARALHRLVSHDGVHGHFRLYFDGHGRFTTIVPL
ncbi:MULTISPECIES: DUF2835 family protein [unclassified Salinicola]|uniref:DUF2835 family protein n=1 Tax=unclassified Salinicola TaxID=2634022 RepID=UPI0004E69910|nr:MULTISPECIES: DUF2835 family protein [unclassified Salinicola]KFF48073.1 hypothetical protein GY26_16800 [Gammaproteobacteria bacterium MFB021]MCE3028485.1 DUF2835 domain-containing protein [Salinicola sp. DM10]WIX33413.1 DUF2835 family protein [Salinicola sp. JS01]